MTIYTLDDGPHCCEYRDCEEEGTIYDTNLQAWLCEKHDVLQQNMTGYCSRDWRLGYGCDGSC